MAKIAKIATLATLANPAKISEIASYSKNFYYLCGSKGAIYKF